MLEMKFMIIIVLDDGEAELRGQREQAQAPDRMSKTVVGKW